MEYDTEILIQIKSETLERKIIILCLEMLICYYYSVCKVDEIFSHWPVTDIQKIKKSLLLKSFFHGQRSLHLNTLSCLSFWSKAWVFSLMKWSSLSDWWDHHVIWYNCWITFFLSHASLFALTSIGPSRRLSKNELVVNKRLWNSSVSRVTF